jgi:hypothetical protein
VGNESNDFGIPDGPFANQIVRNEKPHCLRCQWNSDQTLPLFGSPEWNTAGNQLGKDSYVLAGFLAMNSHFKTHLSIGGYEGDMNITVAPNVNKIMKFCFSVKSFIK